MAITVDQLMEAALCLSGESRLFLAERLIESVPPDPEIFRDQLEVARHRGEELESGIVQGIPGEEALRRVREVIQDLWRGRD